MCGSKFTPDVSLWGNGSQPEAPRAGPEGGAAKAGVERKEEGGGGLGEYLFGRPGELEADLRALGISRRRLLLNTFCE